MHLLEMTGGGVDGHGVAEAEPRLHLNGEALRVVAVPSVHLAGVTSERQPVKDTLLVKVGLEDVLDVDVAAKKRQDPVSLTTCSGEGVEGGKTGLFSTTADHVQAVCS